MAYKLPKDVQKRAGACANSPHLEMQDPGTFYTNPRNGDVFVTMVDKTTGVPLWVKVLDKVNPAR